MKDQILILKTIKYLDYNLIVTGLSRDGSKKSFMAPSALKSKKRFSGGVLEPTHFVEIQYSEPRSEDRMPTLQEARLIEGFDFLRQDYDKLQTALTILNYAEHVAQEELGDNSSLFGLVGHALKALENSDHPEVLGTHFEIKVLNAIGVLEPEESLSQTLRHRFLDYPDLNNLSLEGRGILERAKGEYLKRC